MPTQTNCLIRQADCGLSDEQTECPKCGMRTDVRYVSNEDLEMAVAKGTAIYWKNHSHALTRTIEAQEKEEREQAERAEIERTKTQAAREQAKKEKQKAERRRSEEVERERAQREAIEIMERANARSLDEQVKREEEEARRRAMENEWSAIRDSQLAEDFKSWLAKYPNSHHNEIAIKKFTSLLAEDNAWDLASKVRSTSEVVSFLKTYPGSRYAPLAKHKLFNLKNNAQTYLIMFFTHIPLGFIRKLNYNTESPVTRRRRERWPRHMPIRGK